MYVVVTYKNEDDSIKNEGARVFTKNFPIISLWGFFQTIRASNSVVLGPIWPNFELIRDVIVVLITCNNEEDPIKNEGARVFTTLYIFFQTLKGR